MTFHRGKIFIYCAIVMVAAGCGRVRNRISEPFSENIGRRTLLTQAEYVIPETIGVAYWDREFSGARPGHVLEDSVARLARKGFQTYKIPLDVNDARGFFDIYLPNSSQEDFLADLANTEGYRAAFSIPGLRTIVLSAFDSVVLGTNGNERHFADGTFLRANKDRIVNSYYLLARQLYRNHRGSQLDFIITGWELDNSMYCGEAYTFSVDAPWNYYYDPSDSSKFITLPSFRQMCLNGYVGDAARGIPPIPTYQGKYGARDPVEGYQNVTLWFQYRQEGIRKARAEEGAGAGVTVRDGIEFNTVRLLRERTNPATGRPFPSALYDVVPVVRPEVASYSAYESTNLGTLLADFPLIEQQAAGLEIGISEYGFGEEEASRLTTATQQVLGLIGQKRLSFAILWQAFHWTLTPQMGLLKRDGSNGTLFEAVLQALPAQPDPVIVDYYPSGTSAADGKSYATIKGLHLSIDGDNTVTSDCPGLEKTYDGFDGAKAPGVTQINVRVPLRNVAFKCTFTVTKPSGTASKPVTVDMDFIPTPQPSPSPTPPPPPVLFFASPAGTSTIEQRSYATLKGTGFSANGDNVVTSSCAGLEKTYDGVDGQPSTQFRQINVRVPLRTSAFTCTFRVTRPDGSFSNTLSVDMGFVLPPAPAAITQSFPAGFNQSEQRSYASLKGTGFSAGANNIVTSDCAGLEKTYDGVDGGQQPGIRQINVRVPLRTQAFNCTFQVRRPDGSAASIPVTVAMPFVAPPLPQNTITITEASSPGPDPTTGNIYIVVYGSGFGSGAPFAQNSSDGNTVRVTCDQGTYIGMFGDTYTGAGVASGKSQINTTIPAGAAGHTNCRATVIYNGTTSAPSTTFSL